MSNERRPIYMDHSATTPVRAEALAAMEPYFAEFYGNPSSMHSFGRRSKVVLEEARRTIAGVIGAKPREVIFTGCGSESDNAALRGIAIARREKMGANRIITSPIEHEAVLYTAEDMRDHYGFDLALLPVDGEGRVNPAALAQLLGDGSDVALVSVMYVNNEVGTVQPIAELGATCHERGVPFHSDAVQAAGKLPLNVDDLNVDALSVSAHKFYGPKGVGFLYLRSGTPYLSYLVGGGHENGHRAGTENVAFITAMATALVLGEQEREEEADRLRTLRDQLIGGILEGVDGARLTGSREHRLANHASFVIEGVEAEGFLIGLDMAGVAASSGSACTSGAQEPSHVLTAMGVPASDAVGALRLTLGRSSSPEDVAYVVDTLPRIIHEIRGGASAH
ncbi:MAG: cysteine desulfurase family protein [Caldilineaceae bacterium]